LDLLEGSRAKLPSILPVRLFFSLCSPSVFSHSALASVSKAEREDRLVRCLDVEFPARRLLLIKKTCTEFLIEEHD